MVDVVETLDFDALVKLVQAIDERLKIVEANMKVMPDTVKAALKQVLDWMYTNV